MASSSSSSGDQQVVLCGSGYVHVYKPQSQAAIDLTVEEEEQPPYVIVVHGTRKVGKSLLIKSLVDHYYTKENHNALSTQGSPVTIITGEQRRIQFVECPNNVNGMLDAAKYADAVILVIDAYIGFEMETFEFVNILRVHGMPKVMGVLTSIDLCENVEKLFRTKEYLMNHFWSEIYEGARIFCLSGLNRGMYPKHEILDLASFISVMEFRPLSWRAAQPYVLVDHFEDVTRVSMDSRCNRDIVLHGYLRGCDIKKQTKVHIAGVGDFPLFGVTSLDDPCPLMKRYQKGKEQDEYSGFKPGAYLRLEFRDVPFDMVGNIDPYYPILVGGISPGEENIGYIQAKLKRHTWHRKLLKTRDPIIVSIGWRRYQTNPIYALQDHSERLRMLNYTPVDKQCLAMFWGPLASPNTGFVVVQYLPDDKESFRILATAVVVDFNNAAKILKKCKRSGTPWKISGKTALIEDLFRSDHEIDIFKDAKLWTESGIQGKVKKAAENVFVDSPDGLPGKRIAKCSFKRRICTRDTIFMRVWKEVEVPRFFKPSGLLGGPDEFKRDTYRKSPYGRRMVSFVEGEPSFADLARAKNFELRRCNAKEQKEFEKHPVLVVSKEDEMSEKKAKKQRWIEERKALIEEWAAKKQGSEEEGNALMEEWEAKQQEQSRKSGGYRHLYGHMIPTYLKFFCGKRDCLGLTL